MNIITVIIMTTTCGAICAYNNSSPCCVGVTKRTPIDTPLDTKHTFCFTFISTNNEIKILIHNYNDTDFVFIDFVLIFDVDVFFCFLCVSLSLFLSVPPAAPRPDEKCKRNACWLCCRSMLNCVNALEGHLPVEQAGLVHGEEKGDSCKAF